MRLQVSHQIICPDKKQEGFHLFHGSVPSSMVWHRLFSHLIANVVNLKAGNGHARCIRPMDIPQQTAAGSVMYRLFSFQQAPYLP